MKSYHQKAILMNTMQQETRREKVYCQRTSVQSSTDYRFNEFNQLISSVKKDEEGSAVSSKAYTYDLKRKSDKGNRQHHRRRSRRISMMQTTGCLRRQAEPEKQLIMSRITSTMDLDRAYRKKEGSDETTLLLRWNGSAVY